MQRTQILLEDWQVEALKAESQREGTSLSGLIRTLVAQHLDAPRDDSGLDDLAGIVKTGKRARRHHDEVLYRSKKPRKA